MNGLTLEQLASGLKATLSDEASEIILEDVIIKLDELHSLVA